MGRRGFWVAVAFFGTVVILMGEFRGRSCPGSDDLWPPFGMESFSSRYTLWKSFVQVTTTDSLIFYSFHIIFFENFFAQDICILWAPES